MSHRHGTKTYSPTLVTDSATVPAITAAIAAHVAAMHTPIVPPTPVPPSTGIPPIPPATGTELLRKDFSDGHMNKADGSPLLVAQDYPNVHEADKDAMLGWKPDKSGRYLTQDYHADASVITVHDGYLDLRAYESSGLYHASLVASFAKNDGTRRNFDWQYGTMTWCARIIGTGAAAWQTPVWLLDAWRSPEIDPGEVIGAKLTVNLHGSAADGQKASFPVPAGWYIGTLTRTPTTVSGTIAGAPWSVNVAMPARMPILLDAKYGLAYPDATTPAEIRAQVAWLVVTP